MSRRRPRRSGGHRRAPLRLSSRDPGARRWPGGPLPTPGRSAGWSRGEVAGELGDGRQVNALAHEPGDVHEPPINGRSASRLGLAAHHSDI